MILVTCMHAYIGTHTIESKSTFKERSGLHFVGPEQCRHTLVSSFAMGFAVSKLNASAGCLSTPLPLSRVNIGKIGDFDRMTENVSAGTNFVREGEPILKGLCI